MRVDRRCFLALVPAVLLGGRVEARAPERPVTTRFRVLVPAEAEVLIEGERMRLTGESRVFESPALPAGGMYRYEFRIRHAGKEVVRQVRFQAGRPVELDFRPEFTRPAEEPARPPAEESGRRLFRPLRPLEALPRRVYA